MEKLEKARVDEVLVLQGLCESRSQAKAFVLAGQVRLGSQKLDKAAKLIPTNAPISLERPMPYVGRGGLKMENFLRESGIPPPPVTFLISEPQPVGSRIVFCKVGQRVRPALT